MRRNGSIIGTLAIALVATVGVVGGGYSLVTGNTLCSLASACDTSTKATQVAQTECATTKKSCTEAKAVNVADASTCSKPGAKAVAAADTSTCSKSGVKTIAAADASACAEKASTCSKTTNVADTSTCSKSGVKTVAAADASACAEKASTCSKTGAKAVAVADTSTCSKSGVKTVAAADAACAEKASACSTKTVAAADTSTCSKSGVKTVAAADADCADKASTCSKTTNVADTSTCSKPGAKAVAAADASACSKAASECSTTGAKAVAVGDTATCSKSGAQAVAVASYSCNAEAVLNDEQMVARGELHNTLMPMIQGVRELDNGYAIDFPACSKTLVKVAEMVAMSRECCEFMDYQIVADSKGGAVHLIMTGDAGAKAFLAEAMGPMVTEVADTGSCDACPSKGAKAMNASDDCNACPSDKAKTVAAANAADCNACPSKAGMTKSSKVVATKIDINDACCEKGIKAVKAGKAMPKCCVKNAGTAELE